MVGYFQWTTVCPQPQVAWLIATNACTKTKFLGMKRLWWQKHTILRLFQISFPYTSHFKRAKNEKRKKERCLIGVWNKEKRQEWKQTCFADAVRAISDAAQTHFTRLIRSAKVCTSAAHRSTIIEIIRLLHLHGRKKLRGAWFEIVCTNI